MSLPASPRSVITGAGSGFGRGLALALARRGGRLVLGDIQLDAALETARMAKAEGATEAIAVACDVTKLEDLEALAAACPGPVDLLINNAGVSSAGLIGEIPISDWRWTMAVDLDGVINGCHVFVPILRKQGHGHVLNVASAAGIASAPNMGPYNVAKAGVIALSETLSAELSGTRIGVTVVCPTFFRTNIITSGRFTDERTRRRAARLVTGGKSVELIVSRTLRAVDRDALYALPMADARILWWLKRLVPSLVVRFMGRMAERQARP